MSKKSSSKKQQKKVEKIEHELIPLHIKLSEDEKKKLLEELNAKEEDLPKIRMDDPAIKHINPKPGDVIKIIRRSPTAGEYVYYRVVVEE